MDLASRFDLTGRVALVTGGAGALGTAISEALAEAGAITVIAGRNMVRGKALAAELGERGLEVLAVTLDLSDNESIQAAVDVVLQRFGRFDILVHNAVARFAYKPEVVAGLGVAPDTTAWEQAMCVNATGYFALTQLAIQQMRKQGYGNIISIASIYGSLASDPHLYPSSRPERFRPDYYFAKAGVINFTRYLAVMFARFGIRANCISPGPIDTGPRPADQATLLTQRIPLGKLGTPDDIKGAIVFLASDASSWMTGHDLVLDGGFTCC
jgi:NAD(P)-dependent dehydrogenase (short-subunit alcohol dehydrogenase family)